jgi:protein-disulfide isomerase
MTVVTCLTLLAILAPVPLVAQEDAEARKEQILANLKLQFPQLEKAQLTMGEITTSEFAGLDRGSFTIVGRGDQHFFVTNDNTKLWMIGAQPIDVSKSTEELAAEIAKREAAKAAEAAERVQKLNDAIAGEPVRGNPDGTITIVEFSDFQCPYCTRGAATVEQLLEKYPNDVKFVFKHFPLGFHNWAKPAAIAANCAGDQKADAFWALHDKYFEEQGQINKDNVLAKSKEYLAGAGLDMAKWSTCATDTESAEYKAVAAEVDADMELGKSLGVSGTPGFFVNGTFLNGAQPPAAFEPLIQSAKAGS